MDARQVRRAPGPGRRTFGRAIVCALRTFTRFTHNKAPLYCAAIRRESIVSHGCPCFPPDHGPHATESGETRNVLTPSCSTGSNLGRGWSYRRSTISIECVRAGSLDGCVMDAAGARAVKPGRSRACPRDDDGPGVRNPGSAKPWPLWRALHERGLFHLPRIGQRPRPRNPGRAHAWRPIPTPSRSIPHWLANAGNAGKRPRAVNDTNSATDSDAWAPQACARPDPHPQWRADRTDLRRILGSVPRDLFAVRIP